MCRLAAFPPGTMREAALAVLTKFLGCNTDGTGEAYVQDGKFVQHRYPYSMERVIKEGAPFLSHMPYDGYTIAHLRQATHGENEESNTHPFIKGDWAICHNGVFSAAEPMRIALYGLVEFEGETDTEVCAHLFAKHGPEKFSKVIKSGGVYLGLHRSGGVAVVKTTGDLEIKKTPQGLLLASAFYGEYSDIQDTKGDGIVFVSSKGELLKDKTTITMADKTDWYRGGGTRQPYFPGEDYWRNYNKPVGERGSSTTLGTSGLQCTGTANTQGASSVKTALEEIKELAAMKKVSLWHFDPDAMLEEFLVER